MVVAMQPRVVKGIISLSIGIGVIVTIVSLFLSSDPSWRRGAPLMILMTLGSIGIAIAVYFIWCSTNIYEKCKMFPGWLD